MNFKDLKVWQKSRALNLEIYKLTKNYPKEEQFGLTNQIRRCSVSISSNIAEGCARESLKEYLHFLYIAKASCSELECQIILSEDIGYITKADSQAAQKDCLEVIKMLSGVIKTLKEKLKT